MKMRFAILGLLIFMVSVSAACLATFPSGGGYGSDPVERWDRSDRLVELAAELERRAVDVARSVSDQMIDRGGSLSDDQIAVLFASEGFSSASRLFLRLTERGGGYTARVSSRSGLERAYRYLARDFNNLEAAARRAGIQPYALSDCASILRRMDSVIGGGGLIDDVNRDGDYTDRNRREQEDWNGKYVKGRDAAVFLIERRGTGDFIRRPFKNLESLFKYNYDLDRGKNPWGFVAEVPANTLDRMRKGALIERTFEGLMIIEPETRPNRPVYLIRGGKRHGLSRPELVARYGGWGKVYEVPREVIDAYPEGEVIK
jgi:hypothetical protein